MAKQEQPILPISYTELEKTEWPEDIFIDGGMLSRGDRMMIAAESKGGKSTLINDLNRELVTGGSFLGFKVAKPLKVLYMQAELRPRRLKERLMPAFSALSSEAKDNFKILNTFNQILLPADTEKIGKFLDECESDVLEIDPLINFHNFDENSASQMAQLFRSIDQLKDNHNVATILAHHFKKNSTDKARTTSLLDYIRGSTALRGWADTTIALEGRTPTEFRELEFEMRNNDEAFKRFIKYNPTTKSFDWHNPIQIVADWAQDFMVGKKLNSTQLLTAIMNHHGDLFSRNKNKVQSVKDTLVRTRVLIESQHGSSKVLSLP